MNDLKTLHSKINNKYNIIEVKGNRDLQYDANALYQISKAIDNNTIFDCLLKLYDSGTDSFYNTKILLVYPEGREIFYYTANETRNVYLWCTTLQYEALSIIQSEMDRIEGTACPFPFPSASNDGFLIASGPEYFICTPDGYKYEVTMNKIRIENIVISSEKVSENEPFIAIDYQKVKNLIGYVGQIS